MLVNCLPVKAITVTVSNVSDLMNAVNNGSDGDIINIAPGTYTLASQLLPKQGMKLIGAGLDQTTINASPSWQPGINNLPIPPDPATRAIQCSSGVDIACIENSAYLIYLNNSADNIEIANIEFTATDLHGAIAARRADHLDLHHLYIHDFNWSGIRTVSSNFMNIHDNIIVDTGDQYSSSHFLPGAIQNTWYEDSEFWNNRIYRSENSSQKFWGMEGHQGRRCHYHHNDIGYTGAEFAMELAHQNDSNIEVDHNHFHGTISIPKPGSGGTVVPDGVTMHFHHNWLESSYTFELPRNSIEIDHNLVLSEANIAGTNRFIANFANTGIVGYAYVHDNNIRNIGRNIAWMTGTQNQGIYDNFHFYNNHVRSDTTIYGSPLFNMHSATDFTTVSIRDNIFENINSNVRALTSNDFTGALIENNKVENICRYVSSSVCEDYSLYPGENIETTATQGPLLPLNFTVGINDEYTVNSWSAYPTGFLLSLSNNNVNEEVLEGTVVGDFTINMPGIEDYSFEIAAVDGNRNSTLFKVIGNSLQVRGFLDFETSNNHTVTVEARGPNGVRLEQDFTIQINDTFDNEAPIPVIVLDKLNNNSVKLSAASSSDLDGYIATYNWDFGDGFSATGENLTHTYQNAGNYNITLTVRDNAGRPASVAVRVSIKNINQSFKFIKKNKISENLPSLDAHFIAREGFDFNISFDASSSNSNNSQIALYKWSFGDGNQIETDSPIYTHSYLEAGEYKVTLIIVDTQGHEAKSTQVIEVSELATEENISKRNLEPSPNLIFGATKRKVNHKPYRLKLKNNINQDYLIFSQAISSFGADTFYTSITSNSINNLSLKIEEEQSQDEELKHIKERVSYILLDSSNPVNDTSDNLVMKSTKIAKEVNSFERELDGSLLFVQSDLVTTQDQAYEPIFTRVLDSENAKSVDLVEATWTYLEKEPQITTKKLLEVIPGLHNIGDGNFIYASIVDLSHEEKDLILPEGYKIKRNSYALLTQIVSNNESTPTIVSSRYKNKSTISLCLKEEEREDQLHLPEKVNILILMKPELTKKAN